ncbi:MAG TPA: hypothetical protein PLO63_14640 [Syntrophales bacterium]|nr:hypothetical protein [Syntrophales bacterium]
MVRKNEELLNKLSALKPSAPTRTRSVKPAKGKAGGGSPGTSEKRRSSGRAKTPASKSSPPGAAGKKKDRAKTADAAGRKGAPLKAFAVKAAGGKKTPEPETPLRKPNAPDERAAQAPVTPTEKREGLSTETGSPFRPDAWKTGFFRFIPGMDGATIGDPSFCRRSWFDGWFRFSRLILEVADLQWKVMLSLARPWPGGR